MPKLILKHTCLPLLIAISLVISGCQSHKSLGENTRTTTQKIKSLIGLGPKDKIPEIDKKGVVDIAKSTQQQIQELLINMPTGQWVYIENDLQGLYDLQNKNAQSFILSLRLNCKITTQRPSFSIQNADNQVVLKAYDDSAGAIQFLLDNKNYGNPFDQHNTKKLDSFKQNILQAKNIKIFNAGKLYSFDNQKSELLNKAVSCNPNT
ncbi:hypothetical protein [Acinetobacter larvae]|uniref:Uncharacterized protein n=1 Tax=Acinetobacter larvae TaxID=1789224 RepID=A0A1B2LWJ5_9GAMM|nr:hypothetical protein [Acinetobacter larvae]AOA57318.1 hypothetical protein BFG52_02400 [Acinetobacter larvae]